MAGLKLDRVDTLATFGLSILEKPRDHPRLCLTVAKFPL